MGMGTEQDKAHNLTVRLPVDLREWLEAEAKKEMRSIANYIVWALMQHKDYRESSKEKSG
jgi:hypothetical protein